MLFLEYRKQRMDQLSGAGRCLFLVVFQSKFELLTKCFSAAFWAFPIISSGLGHSRKETVRKHSSEI